MQVGEPRKSEKPDVKSTGILTNVEHIVEDWGWLACQEEKPTGHSARRSEAKHLARSGWSVAEIQKLGR